MFSINNNLSNRQGNFMRVFVLMVVMSLVASCTIQPTAVIHNGSGSPIIVKLYRGSDEVSEINIMPGTSEKLREWLFYDVQILSDEKEYRYVATDPGSEYIISSGFGPFLKRRVYLEFNDDGRVFVFRDPKRFGQDPPVQPPGFPLVGS